MSGIVRSRHTIRKNPPASRDPRLIEPWVLAEAEPDTPLAKLEHAFRSALESVDLIEEHKFKARQSNKFTDAGIVDDALKFAASKLAPTLKRAHLAVERARAEVVSRREKLALKPADRADAAGQMRRLYKLDKFNALSGSERNALIAKGLEGNSLDPELAQVFLEMPDYAKVLPSDLERVRDSALRAQHGDEAINEIAEAEEAIKITEIAIAAAAQEIASEVGGPAKLDAAAAPHVAQIGALWLRRITNSDGSEQVQVFKKAAVPYKNPRGDVGGSWPLASPEEIENGRFFASHAEWQAAGGTYAERERKRDAA